MARQTQCLCRTVGTGPGNDRHPLFHGIDRDLDDPVMLLMGEGRGFSRGPAGGDPIRSGGDLLLDQPSQCLLIHLSILKGRNDRNNCASEHISSLRRA